MMAVVVQFGKPILIFFFFSLRLAIEVPEDTKPENTSQELANGNKAEGEQDDNNNAGGRAVCFS